ncbi:hypothetical protein IQ254_07890 [Nodosilinea sp. LEGE 07088]|uniref:hypothetical protein n=1 Tax=Nodosilinea sp. LEGE 07088 TaxID=2777968 RepID=UPI001881D0C9|nr:hypothetical protein [Nodosilinea sp. LEGE 07088]MBE9137124.1 hypothetical protein [Nodosilinea sp. LEGE 07088]
MHSPRYTDQICSLIAADDVLSASPRIVMPASLQVLSAFALRQDLEAALSNASLAGVEPLGLIIWAFSAGCVGAATLATHWQRYRGPVLALFMVDGWGVPRDPDVIVHRLSHDRFTHDTSGWLGCGDEDFYAEPAVPHLDLWRHPQSVTGHIATTKRPEEQITAADFLCQRSRAYLGLAKS